MNPNKVTSIIFYGVGGQGVLKAAEICALAAMKDGNHSKKSEVHGMAQRGGSVESHVRFGRLVYSPLVPKGRADFLVCLHPEEHERLTSFIDTVSGADLFKYLVKANELLADKRIFVNTFMLGVLSAHLDIKTVSWIDAIKDVFGNKYIEENIAVFNMGRKEGELP